MPIDLTKMVPKTELPKYCGLIKKAQTELDEENQKVLFDALANTDRWTANDLAMALRENGFQVHKNAVMEHRKGNCACSR